MPIIEVGPCECCGSCCGSIGVRLGFSRTTQEGVTYLVPFSSRYYAYDSEGVQKSVSEESGLMLLYDISPERVVYTDTSYDIHFKIKQQEYADWYLDGCGYIIPTQVDGTAVLNLSGTTPYDFRYYSSIAMIPACK